MMKLRKRKGFTLAELLIVIAIIAILVAVAIPTFNNALTKAHKAVDDANIRAAYAQWQVDGMMDDTYEGGTVKAATADEALAKLNSITDNHGLEYYASIDTSGKAWSGVEKTKS